MHYVILHIGKGGPDPPPLASDIAAGEEERDVRDCELSGARGIGRVY